MAEVNCTELATTISHIHINVMQVYDKSLQFLRWWNITMARAVGL